MSIDYDEQAALHRAYIALLQLPHRAVRMRLQSVMATLRDEIATGTGREPEDVQNGYEAFMDRYPIQYISSNGKRSLNTKES